MRHKRRGRVLGRSPSHRKAMFSNLVSALILTEREDVEFIDNPPKVKGRIVTTLAKAKEVRPLVEKCITIAKKGVAAEAAAEQFATDAERYSEAWKQWRESDNYAKWVEASAPAVTARRRAFQILRDKEAVQILFEIIAPRFEDRNGGYTRIMRLATPRLGDGGVRAILEFVGKHDRVVQRSEKPAFDSSDDGSTEDSPAEKESQVEEAANSADVTSEADSSEDSSASETKS